MDPRPSHRASFYHLGLLSDHGLPPRDRRMERPQSRHDGRGCTLLFGAHLGGSRGSFVAPRQMRFSITGVNHRTAPVEVRERLAFDDRSLSAALLDLKGRPGFCEGLILSTCNRVEVALTCEENSGAMVAVDQFLA